MKTERPCRFAFVSQYLPETHFIGALRGHFQKLYFIATKPLKPKIQMRARERMKPTVVLRANEDLKPKHKMRAD